MAANNGMKDSCGKRITLQALPQTTHGQNRAAQQTREKKQRKKAPYATDAETQHYGREIRKVCRTAGTER